MIKNDEVHEIVSLRKAGLKIREISESLKININTIASIVSGRSRSELSGITNQNRLEEFGRIPQDTCKVCQKKVVPRGYYCPKHYYRRKRYGDPLMVHQFRNGKGPLVKEDIRG